MTHKQFLLIMAPLLVVLLVLGYCAPKQKASLSPALRVKRKYVQSIERLDASLIALERSLSAGAPGPTLQRDFLAARLVYKELEYLAEYHHPSTASSMNGAPADGVKRGDSGRSGEPRTGFGGVEAILFPVCDPGRRKEALKETRFLRTCVRSLRRVAPTIPMTDYSIFAAMRRQVYRMTPSDTTGAGSPVARHALPEALASLTSLKQTFLTYQPRLAGRAPTLAAWVEKSFDLNIVRLRQKAGADRAARVTSYANVLSSALADAQQALEITAPAGRLVHSPRARTSSGHGSQPVITSLAGMRTGLAGWM